MICLCTWLSVLNNLGLFAHKLLFYDLFFLVLVHTGFNNRLTLFFSFVWSCKFFVDRLFILVMFKNEVMVLNFLVYASCMLVEQSLLRYSLILIS